MTKKLSDFEKRIRQKYGDADSIIAVLRKYDFEKFLCSFIEQISCHFESDTLDKLPKVSSIILTKIYEKLATVESKIDRYKLKYFTCDTMEEFILAVPLEIREQIAHELSETCEVAGYNFKEISTLLKLDVYTILKRKPHVKPVMNKKIYYEWERDESLLDDLLYDLANRKVICSVKEFKKLFCKSSGSFTYTAPYEKQRDLLVIFHLLKKMNMITSRGCSGYLTPLARYGVDCEKNILFKRSPNRIHELTKRNRKLYMDISKRYEKMIRKIAGLK